MARLVMDITNMIVTMNGHRITGGYSDDADAIMFPRRVLVADPVEGADHRLYYRAASSKGGEFTLKFMADGEDAPFFEQMAALHDEDDGTNVWNGEWEDVKSKRRGRLVDGVMISYPPSPNYGAGAVSSLEFTWHFSQVLHDSSDASFVREVA